jgi:hypothetical protein
MQANLEVLRAPAVQCKATPLDFTPISQLQKTQRSGTDQKAIRRWRTHHQRFAIPVGTFVNIKIPVTDEMASAEKFYDALILVGSILMLLSVTSLAAVAWYAVGA